MAQTGLQFHGAPEEILYELVPRWLHGIDFFYCLRTWTEPKFVYPTGRRGPELVIDFPIEDLVDVMVSLTPFDDSDLSSYGFLYNNLGFLQVYPDQVRDGGMQDSMVGSLGYDPDVLKVWRALVRRARTHMLSGAVVVGANGTRYFDRSHRFTPGAVVLASQGVRMLSGNTEFHLTGPDGDVDNPVLISLPT